MGICLRGHFEEYLYDASGALVETVDMVPGGDVLNIPAGQWHSLRSLESGTVLFEAKDGAWEPQADEDVLAALADKDVTQEKLIAAVKARLE